ncbi:uncharacterized protein LOC129256409 [Lytechinus pictus]|uniref:uncharacterized protein LOC129256409 n=1 Tax=Lytechinus pictus TaxID=7653 RepID=UPI00240D3EA9|nr:uncharacterized protein LOC129256409 [Lytechinus pictus]
MPVDSEDIIREVMAEEGASPAEIPDHSKRQGVRGYGQSECENCDRTWSTYRAHVVFDLQEQVVAKIYKQKCKRCKQEHVPSFPEDEFTVMIEKAIKQEKLFRDPNSTLRKVDEGGRRGRPQRPPHESKLCEKCGYGNGKKCWER